LSPAGSRRWAAVRFAVMCDIGLSFDPAIGKA
jgi:hypothetical protein